VSRAVIHLYNALRSQDFLRGRGTKRQVHTDAAREFLPDARPDAFAPDGPRHAAAAGGASGERRAMADPKRATVLLADDHTLLRDMLARLLNATGEFQVVASVANADDALSEAIRLSPDIVVLDIDMPGISCFDAAQRIRARCPGVRFAVLSAFSHDRYIEEALTVKASAFITKPETPEAVLNALRIVRDGGVYFSPEVQGRLVGEGSGVKLGSTPLQRLPRRQVEVLRYIARGMTNKEIGVQMGIAVRTVDRHVARLMQRLGLHDRVSIARYAIREGLVEP
jgi:DNA-binding NarL/FixJ family response regulator